MVVAEERMKSWFWLCVVGLLTSTFPGSARAATSVAVLGVRAIDGDTELERRLSQALREAVSSFEDFSVSDRELSLEQMMLAHGCEEPDATCLTEVARTLGVERLFFGTVQTGERGYELSISAFDSRKNSVENATLRQLASEQLASSVAAKATTSKLVQRLTGRITTGYIIVTAGAKRAEVYVDGLRRGRLDETGVFTLELPTGEHKVRLMPPGEPASEEQNVRVRPGESTRINIEPSEATPAAGESGAVATDVPEQTGRSSRRSLKRIFGWVSLGIGAAFAGATIYSWVRLRQIADDSDYKAYRGSFPRRGMEGGVGNVCREAERRTLSRSDPAQTRLENSARDLCSEADMLEVAQYVFLGGTVVGAGVGTFLLVTSRARPSVELSLRPRFDASSAVLEASASF